MKKLYKLDNINLNYKVNGNDIRVLKNINFEIKKNERVALIGESGSGKTSLLMLMSGLENPSKGSIFFENKDFSKISEEQKTAIRKKKLV
ncbi:MAG: Lipoprotein-releasing system ATP-binding protein LolD [Alphaproteobacteria bacterium MarineAlpha8_Bin1]|nr:MAG: Lipoprotein-releasing system ATP-binding protein LolD [Alphaproteobacteria bacterium MarineAlpha8_Bin1]